MTLQTWIRQPVGRILMTVLALVLAPVVVFAYKFQRNSQNAHWLLWVGLDTLCYISGIGGFTPLWSGFVGLWNGNQGWLQLSIQSFFPYACAIAIAIYVVYQDKITGRSPGGPGGMSSNQGDYDNGTGGPNGQYSLGKGEQRHLEKVSRARAQAAEQKKRDILQGEV